MPGIFNLTCLGTNTKYQPVKWPDANGPKSGDSLSYVHSRFSGVGRQHFLLSNDDEKAFHKEWLDAQGLSVSERPEGKLTHCLIEGPDDIGSKVYQRIALGVMESL